MFPEFSFKRSVVSELGVEADRAWPVGRNFLFPEFSFKRSVVFEPEFPVSRGRPYIRTDSGYGQ
jgi:hypothetical protein